MGLSEYVRLQSEPQIGYLAEWYWPTGSRQIFAIVIAFWSVWEWHPRWDWSRWRGLVSSSSCRWSSSRVGLCTPNGLVDRWAGRIWESHMLFSCINIIRYRFGAPLNNVVQEVSFGFYVICLHGAVVHTNWNTYAFFWSTPVHGCQYGSTNLVGTGSGKSHKNN